MTINTTDGPREVAPAPDRRVNTSRVVEEDLEYQDEDPEILAVLPAGGHHALIEGKGGLRAVPLAAFVALDTGKMHGVAVGEDGRIDLTDGNVEKRPGFAGYGQANSNDKEEK